MRLLTPALKDKRITSVGLGEKQLSIQGLVLVVVQIEALFFFKADTSFTDNCHIHYTFC